MGGEALVSVGFLMIRSWDPIIPSSPGTEVSGKGKPDTDHFKSYPGRLS